MASLSDVGFIPMEKNLKPHISKEVLIQINKIMIAENSVHRQVYFGFAGKKFKKREFAADHHLVHKSASDFDRFINF